MPGKIDYGKDHTRRLMQAAREPPPIDTRFRPPEPGVIVIEFEFGDGLKLGFAEDDNGLFRVRFDRARKQWTTKMQPWMADRLDDATVAVLEAE
jgi:hypothetical protein